jgi:ketosteroid isomerase-like protein
MGIAELNNGRPERAFAVYHPTDSVLAVGKRFLGLAMEEPRGREARIQFQRAWNAEWGEFRFEPDEVVDFGDRLLIIGRIRGSGRASGAGFDGEWAALMTIKAGWIVKEEAFFDHAQALEAAGLPR